MYHEKRIGHLDFLKAVGLTCILLAHVSPPDWVHMLRCFDVPLMVIISSELARYSYQKYQKPIPYWISRGKRLFIPTWLFLVFYFTFEFLMGDRHSAKYYLYSFLLTRYGIGYVWIILIYFYSALAVPLIDRLKSRGKYLVLGAYILYEAACCMGLNQNKLIDSTFFYLVPYGALTYLGYSWHRLNRREKQSIITASFALFILCSFCYFLMTGRFQVVQTAKYPPRLYFLSYGAVCSFGLMYLFENHSFGLYRHPAVLFISRNSMEIYLSHVFVLYIMGRMERTLNLAAPWYVKFIQLYLLSCCIVIPAKMIHETIQKMMKHRRT